MYLPPHFEVKDLERLDVLAAHDSFATLVSQHEGLPFATHMPVLYRRDGADVRLLGHWARRNPQWQTLDGQTVLCILHGPHAYVSPNFYPDPASRVPTWNYAAAHLYGRIRVFEGADELLAMVSTLADRYEQGSERPWSLAAAEPKLRALSAGIVGFEMAVDRVQMTFKLNQNHPQANRDGVARAFLASDDPDARLLGRWMAAASGAQREPG
jgi:transcriptional regulator